MSGMTPVPEPPAEQMKYGFIAYQASGRDEASWRVDAGPHVHEFWCDIAMAVARAALDDHAGLTITALEDALQAAQDMSLDPAFCHQLAAALEAVCAIRALMESGPRAGQVHEGSEP